MSLLIDVNSLARKIVSLKSVNTNNHLSNLQDMRIKLKEIYSSIQATSNKIERIIRENEYGSYPNSLASQARTVMDIQKTFVQNMKNFCDTNGLLSANLSDENVIDSFSKNVSAFYEIHRKVTFAMRNINNLLSTY